MVPLNQNRKNESLNLRFCRFEVVGGDMPGLLIAALHIQCELNRTVGAEVSTGAIPLR